MTEPEKVFLAASNMMMVMPGQVTSSKPVAGVMQVLFLSALEDVEQGVEVMPEIWDLAREVLKLGPRG